MQERKKSVGSGWPRLHSLRLIRFLFVWSWRKLFNGHFFGRETSQNCDDHRLIDTSSTIVLIIIDLHEQYIEGKTIYDTILIIKLKFVLNEMMKS